MLDIGELCAGLLGGLVAICAPCANIHPWEGLVIGLIAGPVTIGCKYFTPLRGCRVQLTVNGAVIVKSNRFKQPYNFIHFQLSN